MYILYTHMRQSMSILQAIDGHGIDAQFINVQSTGNLTLVMAVHKYICSVGEYTTSACMPAGCAMSYVCWT